jgi:hypothetical protein
MRKKHIRIIKQIQEGIPQDLLKRLTKTELQSPTIKKVFEKALVDPGTTERQRRNIQAMLDSGKLDKTVEVLDHEVEKLIDEYLSEEIAKAVKLGRLPAEAPKLKVGQLEAKVLADQRALVFFQTIDYSDPELYKPVEL